MPTCSFLAWWPFLIHTVLSEFRQGSRKQKHNVVAVVHWPLFPVPSFPSDSSRLSHLSVHRLVLISTNQQSRKFGAFNRAPNIATSPRAPNQCPGSKSPPRPAVASFFTATPSEGESTRGSSIASSSPSPKSSASLSSVEKSLLSSFAWAATNTIF